MNATFVQMERTIVLCILLILVTNANAYCPIEVTVRAFIPSPAIYLQGIIDFAAFSGDGRTFCQSCGTARAGVSTTFEINDDGSYSFIPGPGQQETAPSHRYDLSVVEHVNGKPSWWAQLIAAPKCSPNIILACDGKFQPTASNLYAQVSGTTVILHIDAGIPLFKIGAAPTIKLDVNATFHINLANGVTSWTLTGKHTTFPAFEIYINGHVAHTYDPVVANGTPLGLILESYSVTGSGTIQCPVAIAQGPAPGPSPGFAPGVELADLEPT